MAGEDKKEKGEEEEEDAPAFDPLEVMTEVETEIQRLSITLPGMPPITTVLRLYALGLLKYDALRSYVSAVYTIPEHHLHETPQLDLEDAGAVVLDTPVTKEKPQDGAPSKKAKR